MKQNFFMLLAAVLLSSASAFAQSGNNVSLMGDVNGDGRVDIVDVTTVIDIYLNTVPDTLQPTTYYWYVGQTNPSTMTSISPIVTDNTSPGWRKIEDDLSTYSSSKMLWNGDSSNIIFENRDYYYVAVPSELIKIYNAANGSVMDGFGNVVTKEIAGVNYYIYPSNIKARSFVYNIF